MKILLAEDQSSIAKGVSAFLRKNGYDVDVAADGTQALKMIGENAYDAALLDIMMPGASGLDVLRTIRKSGNQMPVMLLTALDGLEDKIGGLESGANDYLAKPFEMRELLARIRAMTNTWSFQVADTQEMGNIILRRSALEMKTPTGCFVLSEKEFAMIETVMRNRGKPVSKEIIKDKIRRIGGRGDDAEIRLFARYLSVKLDTLEASHGLVETGDGYAMVERRVA